MCYLNTKKLTMTNCTSITAIPNIIQNWLNLAQTLKETAGYPLSYATLSVNFMNILPGNYSEHKNKIAQEIKYPANFTEQLFTNSSTKS